MAALGTIATIATLVGTAVSAVGTIAAGKADKASADYEAAQLDINAKEEMAAAQREGEEYRRKKELALSSLQARAAGSGFSATDPTALALADEISKYGTLQEQMAMYGGKSRRAGLEAQAAGRRMSGRAARTGSYYKAGATILGGISTLADKYNPPTARSSAPTSYRDVLAYDDDLPSGWRTTTRRTSGYG